MPNRSNTVYDCEVIDVDTVRKHFPAFAGDESPHFFENAGGSFACRQTIERLHRYYTETKVQPYAKYPASARAGAEMDQAYHRWAEALGVTPNEIVFGPSTSMNTYVLAKAFGATLRAGDEVIVTDQDHEANTGAIRRAAASAGATVIEWQVDPTTGMLDVEQLADRFSERTRLITFPHCSNIIGAENDVATICAMARRVGARTIVDGVSYAPHGFCDIAALGCDVYLFSLYKTFSVHQGLMVLGEDLARELPNQGHDFNAGDPRKQFAPAGPDHAQIASSVGVLDYIEATCAAPDGSLRSATQIAKLAWQTHEAELVAPLLEWLGGRREVRVLGPISLDGDLHRCPTVAFDVAGTASEKIADQLVEAGVMTSWGNFYAPRVLRAMGVDPAAGVVRLSAVHYTSHADIAHVISSLEAILDS